MSFCALHRLPLVAALALALSAPAAAQITGPGAPRRWDDPRFQDPHAQGGPRSREPDTLDPGDDAFPGEPRLSPPRGRAISPAPGAGSRPQRGARKPAATPAEQLDQLYGRLAKAGDEAEAQGVSMRIERLLGRSRSDTANLLMARALTAVVHDERLLAEDLIDRILDLEPGWAEAWMRRGALRAARDDVSGAVADFGKALAIEPRHIGALTGLGFLMLRIERRDEALRVLTKALELNRFLEPAKQAAAKLAAERAGQEL